MTERVTIRVGEDQKRYLDKKDNTSAYVRRLIDADMRGADVDMAGLQIQIETLEKQAQQAAEKEEMYQRRAEELRDLASDLEDAEDAELERVISQLNVPADPSNPAIKKKAEQLGLTPVELADRLEA